VWWCVFGRYT